jgi:hypothetical protein
MVVFLFLSLRNTDGTVIQGANSRGALGAVVFDAVDGGARHGVPEPGGLEVGAGELVAG